MVRLVPIDHHNWENSESPLNEMHIHQQNHWNDILFYWYQWTIGIDESYPFVYVGHGWKICRVKAFSTIFEANGRFDTGR